MLMSTLSPVLAILLELLLSSVHTWSRLAELRLLVCHDVYTSVSFCLSVCLPACQSVCLSVCLLVRLSVCLTD